MIGQWIPVFGDVVKVKDDEVKNFISEVARKVADREGHVVSVIASPAKQTVLVSFSSSGRKKEFKHQFRSEWLELIRKEVSPA
jgi:hypothetical protein